MTSLPTLQGGRVQELSIPDVISISLDKKNIHSSSTSLVVLQMKLTVCKICHKALTVSHQGYRNVQQHINGQMHLLKSKDVDYNTKLSQSLVLKRIA